jgi:hypothetical protein
LVLRLAAAAEDPHNGERLASQGSFPPYRTTCQQPSSCLHIAVPGRRTRVELRGGLAASDCDVPLRTWVNGTLMALRFSMLRRADPPAQKVHGFSPAVCQVVLGQPQGLRPWRSPRRWREWPEECHPVRCVGTLADGPV